MVTNPLIIIIIFEITITKIAVGARGCIEVGR